MDRQEFQLAYQPQVCLETGKVFGVEALLRWHSPELGQVPPDRFVPVAEKTGLMPELGDWVLVSAVRQARRWMEAGTPLRVSVNISATQMQTGAFPARIQQILRRNKVPAAMIELEVTESMLIDNVEQNRAILEEIRQSGVKLALDDFGTGYSNLAYLQHFVFDTLKIDRLFTKSLSGNDSRDVLVRAIIATGRELVSDIIAEGVETEEQNQVLQKLGCSKMQGYLFGRPMTAEDVELQINSESQY
ncbi:EAL domain-containing protein [Marinobacter sp. MMG032]|uniref:EAL domain-containing protein n=1 Tax=Marinobacter sp. MMG032 TaxID=3158548 RepID=A0AAU7MT75_9GAMM